MVQVIELAEGMRFELTVRVDPVQRFSKPIAIPAQIG